MVEKIFNITTPYGKIRASHKGSLHSSTLTAPLIIRRGYLLGRVLKKMCLFFLCMSTLDKVIKHHSYQIASDQCMYNIIFEICVKTTKSVICMEFLIFQLVIPERHGNCV